MDEHSRKPLAANDTERRFFEAAWLVERPDSPLGRYYLLYSTGDTHRMVYATSDSLEGPYAYRGALIPQVIGWTTHASLIEYDEQWWLVYQDSTLSGGLDDFFVVDGAPRKAGSFTAYVDGDTRFREVLLPEPRCP